MTGIFSFFSKTESTSFERKFAFYFFLSRFWVHIPIWVIFFLSKGYTLNQLALINMILWISVIVFEIPTGYIADFFGRKVSLILSYLSQAIGIGLFVIAKSIPLLSVSYVIWGFGITMASGAEDAWVYDEFKEWKIDHREFNEATFDGQFHDLMGRYVTIVHISLGSSQVVGGILASIYLWLPHTIIATINLIVAIFLITIPETRKHYDSQDDQPESTSLKAAFSALKPKYVFALSIIAIIVSSFMDIQYLMQEDFDQHGISLVTIGIYFAVVMYIVSIGSSLSRKYSNIAKNADFIIAIVGMSCAFILMSIVPILGVMLLFCLVVLFRGLYIPLMSTQINKHLDSQNRATSLSIISAVTKIVYIIFSVAITYIIDKYGFSLGYFWTGLAMIVICFPALMIIVRSSR